MNPVTHKRKIVQLITCLAVLVFCVGIPLTCLSKEKPTMADSWSNHYTMPSRGSGTTANPYLIGSAAELAYFAYYTEKVAGCSQSIKLTADIDLSGYTWPGIGTTSKPFSGNFDGDGHVISHMSSGYGLFREIINPGSRIYIQNVTLDTSCAVDSSTSAGGIAAHVVGAVTISGCTNKGTVTSYGSTASFGGIVGEATGYGTDLINILNCANEGFIGNINVSYSYQDTLGGIAGTCTYTEIRNCYNMADVYGGYAGGILGGGSGTILIANCYSYMDDLLSPWYAGGITVGNMSTGAFRVVNCCAETVKVNAGNFGAIYINGTVSESYNYSGTAFTSNGKTQSWYTSSSWNGSYPWDFTNTWFMPGNDFPKLKQLIYITFDNQSGNGGSDGISVRMKDTPSSISIPTRSGYTFGGYYTGTNGTGTQYFNASGVAVRATTQTAGFTLYAKWTAMTTLSVDPNGGSWNGSITTQSFTQSAGSTKLLSVPTRDGYTFEGWMLASGDASISSFGKLLYGNTFFDTASFDGATIYNNEYNGNVAFSFHSPDATLNWKTQKNILRITTSGVASPGLGGFYHHVTSSPNILFYQVMYAKLPVGYTMEWGSNDIGNDSQQEFLTSQEGTGNWEVYVIRRQCGTSGTFSTTGHVFINGPAATVANPIYWDLAYVGLYDGTSVATENRYTDTTIVFGDQTASVRALWREDSWATNYMLPVQAADGYYEVRTAAELGYFAFKSMSDSFISNVRLMNDINLSGHYWRPIGGEYDFIGSFDGQNHEIRALQTHPDTARYAGLFGSVNSLGQKSRVANVHVYGKVTGLEWAGGLIGCSVNVFVENCSFVGSVFASRDQVGGIIGRNWNESIIRNCYVATTLSALTQGCGGIVGEHFSGVINISGCHVSGNVSALRYVGGILGWDRGEGANISNCGVNATVTVTGGDYYSTGGITGTGTGTMTIVDSYFVGEIRSVNGSSNSSTRWNGLIGNWTTLVKENVYGKFDTYFNDTLISTNGFMYGSTDFTNWNYVPTINNGLPVPAGLFHIGSVGTQNIYQYLLSLGFANAE